MPIQVKDATGQTVSVPTLDDVSFATQETQEQILELLTNGTISVSSENNTASETTLQSLLDVVSDAVVVALEPDQTVGITGTVSTSITNFPVTQNVVVQGTVPVSGTFWQATQPVSVEALPLPAGAATDATLIAIRDRLPATPYTQPLTDIQLRASAVPVSVGNFPATQNVSVQGTVPVSGTFYPATQAVSAVSLPLPAGAATDATLVAIRDRLPGTAHTQPLTDGQLRASAVPVSGAFYPATQPVSAVALPLPIGAATDASVVYVATVVGDVVGAVDEVRDRLPTTPHDQPLTDAQLRASAIPVSIGSMALPAGASTDAKLDAVITKLDQLLTALLSPDVSFRERIALTTLAKQTFTTTGLRIDAGGSSVSASIAANQDIRNITGALGVLNAIGYNTQNGQSIQQSVQAFQSGFRRNLVNS